MKFLIDMPVTSDTVPWLRAAGHEAVHAAAVGLAYASDRQVLDVARHEGRIVITADLDYPRLLDRVLAQSAALDLEHSIVVVNRRRIRRRPLPIGD